MVGNLTLAMFWYELELRKRRNKYIVNDCNSLDGKMTMNRLSGGLRLFYYSSFNRLHKHTTGFVFTKECVGGTIWCNYFGKNIPLLGMLTNLVKDYPFFKNLNRK